MIVGFTGTRDGMTIQQMESVFSSLILLTKSYFHIVCIHGGCIGADEQFHKICLALDLFIEVYPGHPRGKSSDLTYRGEYEGANIVHEPRRFLQRNRIIVCRCDVLYATPKDSKETGGTWSTIKYSRRKRKNLSLFMP